MSQKAPERPAITFRDEPGVKSQIQPVSESAWEEFSTIRDIIQERNPGREVTNKEVMDILIDTWWHHERGGE